MESRRRNRRGSGRDPAKKKANGARYRERHREQLRESAKRTREKYPDVTLRRAKQSQQRRRAKKMGAHVERVSFKAIVARDKSRCHLCMELVDRPSFDHLIPVSRGGAHAQWNFMVAHDLCNKRRGTRQILAEETKAGAEAYIAAMLDRLSIY